MTSAWRREERSATKSLGVGRGIQPLLLVGISLVLYLSFVPLSWMFAGRTPNPLRSTMGLDGLPWLASGVGYGALAVILVGLLALYLLALRSPDLAALRRWVAVLPLVASAILLASAPLLSHDIFLFTAYGRMVGVLGLNPYVSTIGDASSDPIVALQQDWVAERAPYGPVSLLVAGGAGILAPTGPSLVTLLRVVAIAGFLLGFFLVGRLAKAAGADEARARLAYAWNPLLILEAASNGHQETVLLALILLAIFAHRRFGPAGTLPLLAVSALIKPVAGFLVPLYLAYAWRERRAPLRSVAVGAAASLAIAVATYAPFWVGPQIFSGLIRTGSFFGTTSLPDVLRNGLLRSFPGQPAMAILITMLATLVPVAAVYLFFLFRPPRSPGAFLAIAVTLLLLFVILALTTLRQWYFLWPFVLAAPLADKPIGRLAIAFTVAATAFYAGPGLLDWPLLKLLFTVALFALPGLWLARYLWQIIRRGEAQPGGAPADAAATPTEAG